MAAEEKGEAHHAYLVADKQPRLHRSPPLLRRVFWTVGDAYDSINWLHIAFKLCAFSYLAFILWITWSILPLPGHWTPATQSDKIPIVYQDFSNYFGSFAGFSECGIRASDLYQLPPRDKDGHYVSNAFCPNRKTLLRAMSDGGRIGFDAPYTPKGCHYRWYSVEEICFILDRFDSVVFIGDSFLQSVYNGFNILLRQDLASGAMKVDMDQCRCNSQFLSPECAKEYIRSNSEAGGYFCNRAPHALLPLDSFPASADVLAKFRKLVPAAPRSRYQPIPIIHSISPSTFPQDLAGSSLLEFLKLADGSKRKTPMLWVGPTAAGHIDIKDRKGNQEIWDFDRNMAKVARENDIEVLNMWNLTVQASSYDGLHFGEKVAITQAMMVINWLSRLESS